MLMLILGNELEQVGAGGLAKPVVGSEIRCELPAFLPPDLARCLAVWGCLIQASFFLRLRVYSWHDSRTTRVVESDEGEEGGGAYFAFSSQQILGHDPHEDFHGGMMRPCNEGGQADRISLFNRMQKVDRIGGRCDDWPPRMTSSGNGGYIINIGHQFAAEDGAVMIRIGWQYNGGFNRIRGTGRLGRAKRLGSLKRSVHAVPFFHLISRHKRVQLLQFIVQNRDI